MRSGPLQRNPLAGMLWLLLLGLLPGCGEGANRLYGSMKDTYGGLPFERVEVLRQEYNGQFVAMHVRYLDDRQNVQVKVTALAPVEEGVEKDLLKDGSIMRDVVKGSQFPDMKSGKIIFETLGQVGEAVEGRFYVTFQANPTSGLTVEGTLNGDFSGTLQAQ